MLLEVAEWDEPRFFPIVALALGAGDGLCNVGDILGVNGKIFGAEAYCERYPAP